MSMSAMGQISAGLTMAILLESATTMTCFAWRTMARNTAASSGSMVVAPRCTSTPQAPMNTLSRNTLLRVSIAVGPVSENAPAQRIVPPVNVTFSAPWLLNSMPMFTAFVITLMPLRWRMHRATCVVVVPAVNPTVSRSRINSAAAIPMRRFSSAKRPSRS